MCYFIYFLLSDIVYNRSFEVYIDDELVFSKIEKYRYPSETVSFCFCIIRYRKSRIFLISI